MPRGGATNNENADHSAFQWGRHACCAGSRDSSRRGGKGFSSVHPLSRGIARGDGIPNAMSSSDVRRKGKRL
jgi:hypothetical protein